jgi:hypothetical protein
MTGIIQQKAYIIELDIHLRESLLQIYSHALTTHTIDEKSQMIQSDYILYQAELSSPNVKICLVFFILEILSFAGFVEFKRTSCDMREKLNLFSHSRFYFST